VQELKLQGAATLLSVVSQHCSGSGALPVSLHSSTYNA